MSDEEKQQIWEAITMMRTTINDILKEIRKTPSYEEELENSNSSGGYPVELDR